MYDSRIWQIVASGSSYSWQPTNVPNSQAGWRFLSGNETGTLTPYGDSTTATCPNNGTVKFSYYTYTFLWVDPSGTTHVFPVGTTQMYQSSCNWNGLTAPNQPTGSAYSEDAENYYMTVTNYTTAMIYDGNGNQVYPNMADTNGNSFSQDANGNLVDTIGRTPVLKTVSGNQTYYDVLTIGGARKRYTVTTETINVNTAFGQSGVSEYSGPLTAVASVGLPDGTSYQFTYDTGTASGNYGEVEGVVLPAGGTVTLGYQNYLDSYQNQNRWINNYHGGNGSYSFAPQVVTQCAQPYEVGCQEKMTVTDGNGNDVAYHLTLNNGAWNTEVDYFKAGASTPFLTTNTVYNFANTCQPWDILCNGSNYIKASTSTTTLAETGQMSQTVYTYNNLEFNRLSKLQQWDYYTGSPSTTPTKETDYAYGYSVNGALLVTQQTLLDSSGIQATQATYTYDTGGHGNLVGVSLGLGSAVVNTSSTYDGNGMKLTDVDGNNNTTSYAYGCSDAYLTSVTLPIIVNGSHLQTQSTYDCSSGLVLTSEDANGVVTNQATVYAYFSSGASIGKLNSISYPDGGSTTYLYPSATETDRAVALNASVNITSRFFLDTFGRPYQTLAVAPEGNISSETTYDATGRPSCVTTAHLQGTGSSTDGTTCKYYDVVGRVTEKLDPDGNSANYTYNGPTQTIADELGHSRQYTYDAFQRLARVLEPNASGALAYETDYTYYALNNLIEVDQWGAASGSTSPGDRKRLFAYDSLGREIAENIPENQSLASPASLTCTGTTSGTKWTGCIAYDANSNTTSTTDNAGNVLSYQYDGLNRVTREIASNGSINYYYFYDYYSGNPNGTNTIGRLSNASNDVNAAASFNYDSMGRLTEQVNWIPQIPGWNTPVSAKYDLAGDLISLTYPDGRVVGQSFDEAARLTGVTYTAFGSNPVGSSYVSTSKFAPPGQPTASTLGNGVGIAAAYNSRQSVTQMAYSNSSGTALWSKQFVWDKTAQDLLFEADGITGNVRQFSYDTLNRLTNAEDFESTGYATATLTISGSEQEHTFNPCTSPAPPCPQYIYDGGGETISINGVSTGIGWSEGSTTTTLASSLASGINSNSTLSPLVTATASGSTVLLTSKIAGPEGDYAINEVSTNWNTSFFSAPSFTISFPTTLSWTGSTQAPNGLNEAYTYDPFGNLTDSGSYSFSQSFNSYNQIIGYSYDADGDQNTDIYGHALAFDPNGMLSSVAGGQETYVYDALGNRVEVYGSMVTDTVYFGSMPVAMLAGGAYTDLIYSGDTLIAEVGGTQTALPAYRVTDNLGTLGGSVSSTGLFSNPMNYAPYGEQFSGTTGDPFGFAGMQWDPTTATNHATFRQFSIQQSRWQSPDPYSGSYNWADPQSLNRYAYVNGRPMYLTDPNGENPGGWGCGAAIAEGGANAGADAICAFLLVGGAWLQDHLLAGLFGSSFHGSLKPRPNANPWDDKFGVPYGGLGNSIGQAIGLPTGGCEFGACGGISGIGPNTGTYVDSDGHLHLSPDDVMWLHYFFSGISWKNIKESQVDAWNKGYYSCIGNHIIPFKGLIGAGLAKAGEEGLTSALEGNSSWFAGAYYHFTDGRFTAWGRFSKVLVPRLAGKIGAVVRGVSVAGWAVTDIELFHAGYECSDMVF
ncbi:MAG: RHS repeat-associated core domain-containing protein [Terracidiphilus sp.]